MGTLWRERPTLTPGRDHLGPRGSGVGKHDGSSPLDPAPGKAPKASLPRAAPVAASCPVLGLHSCLCARKMEKPPGRSPSQVILLCLTQKCVNAQRIQPHFGLSNPSVCLALGYALCGEHGCKRSGTRPADLNQTVRQRSKPS